MWSVYPKERRSFLTIWVLSLILIYLGLTATALTVIEGEKRAAQKNHALRMSADKVEAGLTPPDPLPPTGDFVPVTVGLYLDNIDTFSIRDSFWNATFYVWFRWTGDKKLDPAKNFQLVEAKIDKRDIVEQYFGEDGVNYQSVRVTARITKFFNTTRVPLDDHLLTISFEDAERDGTQLRYVADSATNMSSRVKVGGYALTGFWKVVKPHTYKTSYGDPRVPPGTHKTFTEFVFGVGVKRAGMGLYFKLLVGLFAGISLTLCSFFIRPSDTSPRFSLPTASYFGAVANAYLANSILPSNGQFGLIDYVTGLGLFTIFLCTGASLVSGYFYLVKKEEALSRGIDRATRTTVFFLYLIANCLLPVAAFTGV
jgi:hypothetical protein